MAEGSSSIPKRSVEPTLDTIAAALRSAPTSDARTLTAQPLASPQESRIAEHAVIAQSDGVHEEDVEYADAEADGLFDVDDEDFVAVDHEDASDSPWYFRARGPSRQTELDQLHPFVQLLSLSDVDECMKVEDAFPENERCSQEKVIYRLTKCPELSLGIFTRPTAKPNRDMPPATLVAHIISTRTPSPAVTDAAMAIPENWRTKKSTLPERLDQEIPGHQDQGQTIALHSLAVVSDHQGKGLGKTLMKAYIQRIQDAKIADRIALLAHEHLIPFYSSLGFENRGPSDCTFGGGGWYNMILEL